MAALRGTVTGARGTASRLGHQTLTVRADTWNTFTTTTVHKDGSGTMTVVQNNKTIHQHSWGPER